MTAFWSLFGLLGASGVAAEAKARNVPGLVFAAVLLVGCGLIAIRSTRMATILVYPHSIKVIGLWRTRVFDRPQVTGFATVPALGGFGRRGEALVLQLNDGEARLPEWWSSAISGVRSMRRVAAALNSVLTGRGAG